MATQQRSVHIGPGRRLTLAELYGIQKGEAILVFQEAPEQHVEVHFLEGGGNFQTCIGYWTVLAFQLVQKGVSSDVQKLVEAVKLAQTQKIGCELKTVLPDFVDTSRAFELSEAGSNIYHAATLNTKALAVSALTVDSLGQADIKHYAEVHFDENRPHRSMVTAAAILRAVLNESRYKSEAALTDEQLSALISVPQYHGPATEQLETAYKRIELEVNSQGIEDDSAIRMSQEQAALAVRLQVSKSLQRQGLEAIDKTPRNLTELVDLWETTLEQEANAAIAIIEQVTASSSVKSKEKMINRGPQGGSKSNENEFDGLGEAQIAKILKKRAEKETKAAAKIKNKEQKTVFGAGTVAIAKAVKKSEDVGDLLESFLRGGAKRKPKIPKGTRDYLPEQMNIRQQAFSIIRRVFESHGAVEIDTPVFELKDTLTGKYGEDSKLIYDLADQGGELLALRYDLTVPFARFLALNSVGNIKRFHIGKVYRRDQPALKRGRYREFYQCDFDIAGNYGRMVPDAECVCVMCDILDSLPIGDFGIKINHRRLLDAILDLCGVPSDKFRTICSAVDKLDKEPWETVKLEMVDDKGLAEDVADKIGEFVLFNGPPMELHNKLMEENRFGDHQGAREAMEDLRILFEYLEAFDRLKFVSFDLSLARGLEYYTGVIYEAVAKSGNVTVGSIGGGGRYDNLVSMFQEAGKQTPCVGVSVGIERVFTLMEARVKEEQGSLKYNNVQVLVASAGSGMMKEKMMIARMLWDANLSAEFSQQEDAKLTKEIVSAAKQGIPFMVIIGEQELAENNCQVKDIVANTAEFVAIPELVGYLRSTKKVIPVGCEFAAEMLSQK